MKSCVFCQIVAKEVPAYIVYEDDQFLAFLDKHPKTRGHLQLIPKRHYQWVYDVPEMGALFELAQKIIHGIIPLLRADHVQLATFGHEVQHAHVWIVPQYGPECKKLSEGETKEKIENQTELARKLREGLNSGEVLA